MELSAIPTYLQEKKKSRNPFAGWKSRVAIAKVEVAVAKGILWKDLYLIGGLCLPVPIKKLILKLIRKSILRIHKNG